MPNAWRGSITTSTCPGESAAGAKVGRTTSRAEIAIGASPSFQVSGQSRGATGSRSMRAPAPAVSPTAACTASAAAAGA